MNTRMAQAVMGGLTIVMGLVATGVGFVIAQHHLHMANQSYRRMAMRHATMAWDWGAWFFGGFSGVTCGLRGLSAVALWLAWTVAGVGVVGLGIRLFGS